MFLPYYTISKANGSSGNDKDYPNVPIEWVEQIRYFRFNPYRDIYAMGTTFGFRGKNYWIGDKTLFGKLIKPLFHSNG